MLDVDFQVLQYLKKQATALMHLPIIKCSIIKEQEKEKVMKKVMNTHTTSADTLFYISEDNNCLPLFIGNVSSAAEKLTNPRNRKQRRAMEKGLKKLFSDRKPTLQEFKLSELEPLESNRYASEKWAVDKITECGGLDMFALGVLYVANVYDPSTGFSRRIVWDGNGRCCIIAIWEETTGIEETYPCLVYDMSLEECQKYFAYRQSAGRRNLPAEVTFVNATLGGDPDSKEMAEALKKCGFFIKGQSNMSVPENPGKTDVEITYNGFHNTWKKICNKDIFPLQLTQNICNNAWPGQKITNDMAMACSQLFVTYADYLDKPKALDRFGDYIKHLGASFAQMKKCSDDWKGDLKGTTGNVGQSKVLAKALLKGFLNSTFSNTNDSNKMQLNCLDR